MRMASWILLIVVAVLIMLGGLLSAGVAYFGPADNDIYDAPTSLADLGVSPETAQALRGRRGTAAAFAAGFATFLFLTALGPYRKGDTWAWWSILCSTAVVACIIALRLPTIGSSLGAGTGGLILGAVIIALLLDIQRLKRA
jgi:hypothetical protein